MSCTLKIFCYFFLALLIGALISYPLYIFLNHAIPIPFEKFTRRIELFVLIALFFPLARHLNLSYRGDFGYTDSVRSFIRKIIFGLIIGISILLPLVVVQVILGIREIEDSWQPTMIKVISVLLISLFAGLVIATIEETFCRGAMFSCVKRDFSVVAAVVITSAFYAAVHFLKPQISIPSSELNWLSGLVVLKDSLDNFLQPKQFFDSFAALFFAGVLLALVRQIHQSIALCIGIHAGSVFVIKTTKTVSNANSESHFFFLVGSYDKVIGHLATLWLTVVIVIYLLILFFCTNTLRQNLK